MSTTTRIRPIVAVALVLSLLGLATQAAADDGWREPTVVATGLDQPRHLAISSRGDLFVTEAGSGGDLEEVGFFAGADHCTGLTGAVTMIDRLGQQSRVASGLPSAAQCVGGAQGLGPSGIVAVGDRVAVQMGSTASFDPNLDLTVGADLYGRVLESRRGGGTGRVAADITAIEQATDPDGEGYDSNPSDLASYRSGYVVTDAGANAVHVIDRRGQVVRTVEVPQEPCPGGAGNCFGDEDLDSVPTGIVRGRGDIFYISTLSGVVADFTVSPPAVGFQPGRGKIFAFNARTGEIAEFAGDLTTVIDVAYDARAQVVYAAEFITGRIVAIDEATGARTEVSRPGEVIAPGGLVVDRDGNLYVSVFAPVPGNAGQVLRYRR